VRRSLFLGSLTFACAALACSGDDGSDDLPIAGSGGSGTAGTSVAGGAAGRAGGGTSGSGGSSAGTAGTLGRAGSSGAAAGGQGGGGAGRGGTAGTAGASAGSSAGSSNTAGSGGTAAAAGAGGAGASGSAGAGGASGGAASGGMAGAGATAGGGAGGAGGGGFRPCPTNGDPCRILPFGDSITDGVGVSGGGSYRIELFRKALEAGKDITFTGGLMNGPQMVDGSPFPRQHEGHSGWKIAALQPLIPAPAFEPLPHIVLLHIGTNDIAQNDNLSQAPMRLGALIDDIVDTAPDALVVVAKIIPLSLGGGGAIDTYNDAIPGIVQTRASSGKHVILVDQNTGFPDNELADGVHPNAQGYARMAGVWWTAIQGLLP
jgi:hypothetical protein